MASACSPDQLSSSLNNALVWSLPDHLIESIFLKLRVKSLLRFHSLSSQWRSTISSPSFTSLHMKQTRDQTTSACIVVYSPDSYYKSPYVEVHAERISTDICHQPHELADAMRFRLGIFRKPSPLGFSELWYDHRYSSCNGLLCTARFQIHDWIPTFFHQVWNPATGQHREVARPREMYGGISNAASIITGLGYDPTIDDYKIILTFFTGYDYSSLRTVLVWSLKSNTWRSVDPSSASPDLSGVKYQSERGYPVSVAGDVYWIVGCDQQYKILKCNLAEERFELLHFPESTTFRICRLSSHNESLYLFIPTYSGGTWMVWMLQMKDGDAIWQKVASVPNMMSNGKWVLEPLGFNCSGHVIMFNVIKAVLMVYVPGENQFVELGRCGWFIDDVHLVQMETLTSPI